MSYHKKRPNLEDVVSHPSSSISSTSYTHDGSLVPPPPPPPPPYTAFTPARQKFILAVVTLAGFFGPLCGAVYLPSLLLFEDVFKASTTVINATVGVYMVVFAVAPLFGAAASDIGGRKTVYMVGLGSFLIANVLLAVLPSNIGSLFILRIFQAFGSCIVFSVGAGTVADIAEPKKRASCLAWFLLGPQVGPILGPLIGGQFAHVSRWRWVFGFLALASAPVYFVIVFSMPETLRSLVGNGAAVANQPWFSIPKFRTKPVEVTDGKMVPRPPRPSFRRFMRLLKYPPHLIVSFNGMFQFTGLYAVYIIFPEVWQERYGWSAQEVGYAYLVPGISLFVASIGVGRLSDFLRRRQIANSPDGDVAPERRITIQIGGFVIGAAGKLMFGWFIEKHSHPAGVLVGSGLAAVGTSIIFITSTSFQTECDPTQTASLVALGGFLRNAAAAVGTVTMHSIVRSWGPGKTFTGFSVLDLLCIPGILLIIVRGKKFRGQLQSDQVRG
ncbi:MFS general substrate transporter [Lentithecium fluviatile CBS 122367]|uniref:MFS general substrate transporter n=1 Tax=Lentithecium fluviatile CBS 122367 TaxID=1168545 RepID=A0A6G1JBX5_9PLEO|nr:MFS general substrate transporter [Lentithecium fluviatile CBS 122367]